MIPTIRVASSLEDLTRQAAERFVKSAGDAVVATGRFAVALSGGSTPQALFTLLASDQFVHQVDWSKLHVLFSDERCVPADHAQSNFGTACRLLLDQVHVPYENIHRMAGETDPKAAADEYEKILAAHYDNGLDMVLLGMGDDGHTASLFPGTEAMAATDRRCVANYVLKLSSWRLTLTAGYINRAFEVVVLVAGRSKAKMAAKVLEGMAGHPEFPIQQISPISGRMLWLMDAEAAGMDMEEDNDG